MAKCKALKGSAVTGLMTYRCLCILMRLTWHDM